VNTIYKNQKFKLQPNLRKLKVALGWKVNTNSSETFDLDASAFMLDKQNGIRSKKDFVYYKNLKDPSGALEHSGDSLTGGEGDVETIMVDFSKIPKEIGHVTFVVTIYDALAKQQTFGRVKEAYIRVCDAGTNNEIVRYNLAEEFFSATSILVADIVNHDNEWYFDAVGAPFSGGLEAISADFDIDCKK
jgi:tellurium resistance protein TerD